MNKSLSSIAAEVRISPMWVIIPLAALGVPTIFIIELLWGALELEMVVFFLLFYGVLGMTWLLINQNDVGGKCFFVIAFTSMIWLGYTWWATPELLTLMVVPPVLGAVLIGLPAALTAAMGETVLLLIGSVFGMSDISLAMTMTLLVTIWMIVGLMVASFYPVQQLAQWSWNYFQQAQTLLEEARTRKVELQQALDDLSHANQQLTRMNELTRGLRRVAEEARRVKEEFVANVSHELRTPLNMIIGYSEVILQSPEIYGPSLPQALLADLTVVFKNAEHLSDLIDDVLDLTEIETEQMALTKAEAPLHKIVEAATVAVRPLFESKGLYLKTEVSKDLPPLFCDRTRIREVLLNLLSNAGRFTEQGGVQIRAVQKEQDLVVTVTDTGPGIAEEDKDKLFQPFQQLSSSVRQQYGGSGLGLNISKRFIELHGGDIWVDSTPGVGTTFSFRLPIALPMPSQSELTRWVQPNWEYRQRTRPSTVPKGVAQPRFVVIDYSNTLPRILTRYLDDAEIVSVSGLAQASQELMFDPSTALIINAPSVDETLQRLKHTELPNGIPVIICSLPDPAEVNKSLGAFDYLMKPVSRDLLLATLDRLKQPLKTLLIVDDQPEMFRLYRRMVTSPERGYQLFHAKNGREALQVLRHEKPDAILLDLVMAEMDGFEFLKARNGDPELQNIPVIVISANDPASQPLASHVFAVTKRGGLSTGELLNFTKQTAMLLSTIAPSADQKPSTAHSGG
ncbi:MAG: response regulator [Anaerolineae bacterium]|nr:response regulator [Anaerolineae bacterium]